MDDQAISNLVDALARLRQKLSTEPRLTGLVDEVVVAATPALVAMATLPMGNPPPE